MLECGNADGCSEARIHVQLRRRTARTRATATTRRERDEPGKKYRKSFSNNQFIEMIHPTIMPTRENLPFEKSYRNCLYVYTMDGNQNSVFGKLFFFSVLVEIRIFLFAHYEY